MAGGPASAQANGARAAGIMTPKGAMGMPFGEAMAGGGARPGYQGFKGNVH